MNKHIPSNISNAKNSAGRLAGSIQIRAFPQHAKAQSALETGDKQMMTILFIIFLFGILLAVIGGVIVNRNLNFSIAQHMVLQSAKRIQKIVELGSTRPLEVLIRKELQEELMFGDIYQYKIYDSAGIVIEASQISDIGKRAPARFFDDLAAADGIEIDRKTQPEGPIKNYMKASLLLTQEGEPTGAIEIYTNVDIHSHMHWHSYNLTIGGFIALLLLSGTLGGILILRSIRERQAWYRRHCQAKQDIKNSSRVRSEFLTNMGHELRTPLNAIIGYSEFMTHGLAGSHNIGKYQEFAGNISKAGNHLLNIINDILELSRIESGGLKLDEGIIDLDLMLRKCLSEMTEPAAEKDIELNVEVSADAQFLNADARLIQEITLHILANAIKFTPQYGAVTIYTRLTGEGCLEIDICDTGIGISAGDLAEIMHPFRQADNSLTRSFDGTGLGLALVSAYAEIHDGGFYIKSIPGMGTCAVSHFPPERVVGNISLSNAAVC